MLARLIGLERIEFTPDPADMLVLLVQGRPGDDAALGMPPGFGCPQPLDNRFRPRRRCLIVQIHALADIGDPRLPRQVGDNHTIRV